jgi:hypothetical protein
MPLVEPSFFETRNLFIDVKLSAVVGGSVLNYMGTYYQNEKGEKIEVIDIGFYKDNVAFGITNIEVTVNTSLQPVIKIDFKDVAGSTSFRGDANKAGINYSQLFNWPPAKFKFSFKGYLGGQVTWLLNLKQYSIGYEPSDGTTKISAEFVPNQFGFFADIPYLYLRAVKKLRELQDGKLPEGEVAPLGVFDIIEIGDKVSDTINQVNQTYNDDDKALSFALSSFSQAITEGLININERYSVQIRSGASTEDIIESEEVIFNTFLVPDKIGSKEVTKDDIIEKIGAGLQFQVDRWLICNVLIDDKLLKNSASAGLSGKDFNFYAGDDAKFNAVKAEFQKKVNDNITNLEGLKSSQVYTSSEGKVGELSISNVMEAIARDSSYLMGSILDAGLSGYFENEQVRKSAGDVLIGLNYPLTNDTNNNNQEVPASGQYGIEEHELELVRQFIIAITESISEDGQQAVAFGNQGGDNFITNPISNFEVLANSPYKSSSKNIATNMLLRSGVASFLTGSEEINDPERPNETSMKAMAEREFENIKPLLTDLVKNEDEAEELKIFCDFFRSVFNKADNNYNEFSPEVSGITQYNITTSNPNADKISEYKKATVKLFNDQDVSLGEMINKYLGSNSDTKYGINSDLLKSESNYSFIGGQLFLNADKSFFETTRYIVYEGAADVDRIMSVSPAPDFDPSSYFVPEGAFRVEYIEDSYNKLSKAVESVGGLLLQSSDYLNSAILKGTAYSWTKIKDLRRELTNSNRVLTSADIERVLFKSQFVGEGEGSGSESFSAEPIIIKNDDEKNQKFAAIPVAYSRLSTKGKTFDLMNNGNLFRESRTQRVFLAELADLVYLEIVKTTSRNLREQGQLLSKFNNAEGDIYKQFHALYQQWSSMAQGGEDGTEFINLNRGELRRVFSEDFGDNHFDYKDPNYKDKISKESSTAFVYQFPLQSISNDGGSGINIKDAIVNIDPLRESLNNSNTTVLNVIQNICTKNNFTFIPVPGNPGYDSTEDIFTPQLASQPQSLFNTFHIMFLPTPESRTNLANSSTFQSDLVQMRENVNDNVEGFIVKFGSPDNQIVKSVDVDTVDNKVTAESIINLQALVQSNTETRRVTRDCSMLSVMSGRSYKAKLNVLGNAKIFPTQFFFLDRTPLFGGLYQIMNVSHTITPNNMETSFDGIRMRFANSDYSAVLPITKQYYTNLIERFKIGENSLPLKDNGEEVVQTQGETDFDIEDFSDHTADLEELEEVIEDFGDLIIDRTYRLNSNEYFSEEFDKKYIFLHHTAGGPKARYVVDGWNKTEFFESGNRVRIATSFIIGRDDNNRVHECFDPKYWAYHIGIKQASNSQFQKNSIGIELCAYGGLKKRGGKFYAWPNKFGTKKGKKATIIPENEVVTLSKKYRGYKYFHKYSDTQIQALEKLLEYTIEKHNVPVQSNFGMDWFNYNTSQVKNPKDGIYSHSAVRQDKSDMYPDPRVIGVLRKIAVKYS